MTDSNADTRDGARGPRLAAAAVVGMLVPFVLPIIVIVVALSDRRAMRHGRRVPEPPFLHRFAIGLSTIALLAQVVGLVLATSVWSSYTIGLERSGAVGVVGAPCTVADRCCQAIHGAGAGECRPLAERGGEIQGTRESQMSAVNRAVCAEALQAMRGELASAERPLPDACDFAPAGGERSAK